MKFQVVIITLILLLTLCLHNFCVNSCFHKQTSLRFLPLQFLHINISQSNNKSNFKFNMTDIQNIPGVSKLTNSRRGYKSAITSTLNKLRNTDPKSIPAQFFHQQTKMIEQWISKIDNINNEIFILYADQTVEINLDSEFKYIAEVHMHLAAINDAIEDHKEENKTNAHSIDENPLNNSVAEAIANMQNNAMVPKMQCVKFNGMSSEKFCFKNFWSQFLNCVSNMRSDSAKLSYLRSVLTDYAFSVISHLSITDANYQIAVNLLKAEFLDNELIVDQIFSDILNSKPKFDNDFFDVRKFLTKSRADLYELASSFHMDFITSGSSGNRLMSHIIFQKLPNLLKRELVRISNSNYPSLESIFNNYQNLIRTLIKTSFRKPEVSHTKSKTSSVKNIKSSKFEVENKSTLENFNTKFDKMPEKMYYCKFCATEGHSMINCLKYSDTEARIARCQEKNLCELCTSSKHSSKDCYGQSNKLTYACKYCNGKNHISALCNKNKSIKSNNVNVCINTHITENLYLLPILNINVKFNKMSCSFNALLDSGSQRSYFSDRILSDLNINKENLYKIPYEVRTYVGSEHKELNEVMLDVQIDLNKYKQIPILIDNNFNIEFEISDLNHALSNFNKMNLNLAGNFDQSNKVQVNGLLGVDFIQFLQPIKPVKLMNGAAWEIFGKICPYGNILHFLYRNQVTPVVYNSEPKKEISNSNNISKINNKVKNRSLNYNTVISSYSGGKNSQINFILDPKHSYVDPIAEFFDECDVERRVDNMLNLNELESCVEGNTYDNDQIRLFTESIEFKNGSYYVKLPWLKDINKVQSNYKIALSVLDRVIKNLENNNLYNEYLSVFKEQENAGVIEKFHVDPENYHKYIWIPHRAVVRDNPLVSTKVRPVFNCSLKTKGSFSLNECAYPGINLLRDLTELLLYFRTNDYVMISDIKRAFLQIKLSCEQDKARFCFFMKEDDKLVTYRYNTILFGFNCSPFILSYIIKYHLSKYKNDKCNQLLNHNFYCDNLLISSNDVNELKELYHESKSRMHDGGFELRSWNSNSNDLKQIFINDNSASDHGLDAEKILGYLYDVNLDVIKISNSSVKSQVSSKRNILSELSSIFDPLGLCLPVTVRGKFLMKVLWGKKLSWDEDIDAVTKTSWNKLASDLNLLSTLNFKRNVVNNKNNASLFLFCDASAEAYGFCAYAVQNNESNLIFAKGKVSPTKSKTLPTLELLGVYTAFKCIKLLLKSYSDINFENLFIISDAQVVISWLLNDVNKVNCKNKFVINRLKEINVIKEEISNEFNISVKFKYVPSEDNPADLLSRGLSFKKFSKCLDFWTKGPTWLQSSPIIFPENDLKCLNEHNKILVVNNSLINNAVDDFSVKPLIPFDRFSSFDKLVKSVSYVFKFLKFKNSQFNALELAKNHVIKSMQSQVFSNEIKYLSSISSTSSTKPPDLVRDLDLFIDDQGIIRSRGRIGNSQHFDYDLLNPILLAKDHILTSLIVMSIHNKVKHLGLGTTLTQVRLSGFWIPKGRQSVKNIISKCFICKRYNSLAYKYPKLCNLPRERVNFIRAFREVGVDYTSHIFLNTSENNNEKYYILLFTCMQTRAVHIELIKDMTTKSFVQALIRFSNLYGTPCTIYSDNARSFIAAFEGNIISYHLKTDEYLNRFQIFNIKHKRIPLYSPWYGSCWERLIKVVKLCLYKSIGKSKLTYFELFTLISDIQSAINSRPLTYRCSDDRDLKILTPNSFLKPNVYNSIIVNSNQNSDNIDPPSRQDLIKTLENRDALINKFKNVWHDEYLLSLRELHKDIHQNSFDNKIKLQDVVLIRNPAKPRPYWFLGRVVELVKGSDGNIRSAKLLRGDRTEVHHSLKHLYPLELSITHDFHPDKPLNEKVSNKSLNISYSSLPELDNEDLNIGSSITNLNQDNLNNSFENISNNSFENVQEINHNNSDNFSSRNSGNSGRPRRNVGRRKNPDFIYYK